MSYTDENIGYNPWILQQDNDSNMEGFLNNSFTVLEQHSCSQDLNPIKNLWQVVKTKASSVEISNFVDLFAETKKEASEAIPTSACGNLVTSMPRRC